MKKIIFIALLILNSYIGIAQYWTNEEFKKANTAADIVHISFAEKEVIKYINLARLYPQKFAIIEVKDYLDPPRYVEKLKTSPYKKSLLEDLEKKTPVGPVYFDEKMYASALCFAKETSDASKTGHDRTTCLVDYDAECCQYGPSNPRDIVLQLLIDHGVESLGHRIICLDKNYDKIGVSIVSHRAYGSCCIVNFKRKSN